MSHRRGSRKLPRGPAPANTFAGATEGSQVDPRAHVRERWVVRGATRGAQRRMLRQKPGGTRESQGAARCIARVNLSIGKVDHWHDAAEPRRHRTALVAAAALSAVALIAAVAVAVGRN